MKLFERIKEKNVYRYVYMCLNEWENKIHNETTTAKKKKRTEEKRFKTTATVAVAAATEAAVPTMTIKNNTQNTRQIRKAANDEKEEI